MAEQLRASQRFRTRRGVCRAAINIPSEPLSSPSPGDRRPLERSTNTALYHRPLSPGRSPRAFEPLSDVRSLACAFQASTSQDAGLSTPNGPRPGRRSSANQLVGSVRPSTAVLVAHCLDAWSGGSGDGLVRNSPQSPIATVGPSLH
jgi:hypothetical protein